MRENLTYGIDGGLLDKPQGEASFLPYECHEVACWLGYKVSGNRGLARVAVKMGRKRNPRRHNSDRGGPNRDRFQWIERYPPR